jgi:hypothetical protein
MTNMQLLKDLKFSIFLAGSTVLVNHSTISIASRYNEYLHTMLGHRFNSHVFDTVVFAFKRFSASGCKCVTEVERGGERGSR